MAFSNVKAYIVYYPGTLNTLAQARERSCFFENLTYKSLSALTSKTGGDYPKPKHIIKFTKPVAYQYSAQCRESLLSTIQTYVKWMYHVTQEEMESCRIYFTIGNSYSPTLFNRAVSLAGFESTICKQSKTDKNLFSIPLSHFDWCKLSILIFLLRSVDFIEEKEYMADDTLIKAMLREPNKCFPNNSEQPWMTTVLAYAIFNRTSGNGYIHNANYLGHAWFGGKGNGVNSVTTQAIYRDLGNFFFFCDTYNIPTKLLDENLSSPMLKVSIGKLRRIYKGEFTLTPEKVDTKSKPEYLKMEDTYEEDEDEEWDEDSDEEEE